MGCYFCEIMIHAVVVVIAQFVAIQFGDLIGLGNDGAVEKDVFLRQGAAAERPVERLGFFFRNIVLDVPGGTFAIGVVTLVQSVFFPFADEQ